MKNLQVLIIGAGPTGLTLACELARRSVGIRIIERAPEFPIGSRAKGLQARSLEIMSDLGVADELIASGPTEVIFRRFNGSEWLGDVKREVFERSDTRYVEGVLLPQWKVEEVLRAKLLSVGVEVERATELIAFSQNETNVSALLRSSRGEETVDSIYLVGCDGGKSNVRKALGIKMEGETHEEERAFVGDVEVDGLTPDAWHIWMHPTLGFGFSLCPFACSSSWQLQTIALPDAEGQLAEPGLETFRRLFAERVGMEGVTLKNATWASVYRVNIRMADRFRLGRVFIAGDAAHVHSIAGGLGMNTGIQDAYNLGWKLAHVLNNQADEGLLDTYEEERLPIAAWTLDISSERHRAVIESVKSGGDGGLHNSATKDTTQLNLNYRYSSLSKNLNDQASGIQEGVQAGVQAGAQEAVQAGVQAGDRAPDSLLPDGRWLSDVYRGTHFTVLRSGADGAGESARPPEMLTKIFGNNVHVFNLPAELSPLFGRSGGIYVVRPDGYIGLIAGAGEEAAVRAYLSTFYAPRV
jgi:2-polyprenyl-6-methoxyphenol hydroxylase-like FAD-dependent oxidoreductase